MLLSYSNLEADDDMVVADGFLTCLTGDLRLTLHECIIFFK